MSIQSKFVKVGMTILLSLGIATACGKSDEGGGGGGNTGTSSTTIGIANNPEFVDFKATDTTRELKVIGGGSNWRVREKQDVDWLSVNKQGSTLIKLTLSENVSDDVRTATLVLSNETSSKEVVVRQLGALPQILVSNSVLTLPAVGGSLDFTITTNVTDYEVVLPDWINNKNDQSRAAMREVSHSYTVQPNKADALRTFTLEVREKNAPTTRDAIKTLIVVNQNGLSAYASHSAEKIAEDIKIPIASGTDTSHQDNTSDIRKAFDGDYSTIYHSNWSNGGSNYFPITLTLNLSEASNIDYMVYHPRRQGNSNGHFKVVDIKYSTDGTNYTLLEEKDFGGNGVSTRVDFSRVKHLNITSVQLVVKSGAGDGQGFAAAAEIEFYKKNPNSFDPKTLFTDDLCTDLRADVTDAQIQACSDPFFRNLAFYIKQGKYSKDFRVAEYGAYLNPYEIRDKVTKMQYAYSMLDNPTGIFVEAGETLVVLVGDTQGHEGLAIRVIDYYQGGTGDGIYNPRNYPLHRGVNKLKMETKGLVYVLYHKPVTNATNFRDNSEEYPKIKIHFASGSVNGYFDIKKHNASQWRTMLDNAKHQYFDLVGERSHLAFPVVDFKSNTQNNGVELAKLYDDIVLAEQQLHGLQRYNRTYRNRQLLCPTYQDAYMYATNEHTAYVKGTFPTVLNPTTLRGSVWGPAHEIGHIHQTAPGLLWQGMTECTVNIPSAYVQTVLLKNECRLQIENTGGNQTRYTRAFSHIIAKKEAHGATSVTNQGKNAPTDVFRKLVPFWQLQLYFGKVLGRSPELQTDKGGFYPEVYEHLRSNPANIQRQGSRAQDKVFNGAHQLEFVFIASKISGYNLLDFFEKWGFLTPIETFVADYDEEWLAITQDQIDALKQRVNALGLPKLQNVPLEYITDRNADLFKTKPAIQQGQATRSGNEITFTNWKNVVAFEVFNERGELVFVGDGVKTDGTQYDNQPYIKIDIDNLATWKSGYTVKAVSATGERIVVPIAG